MSLSQSSSIVVILLSLFALSQASDFEWNDCGGELVRFTRLNLEPLPLLISKTSKVYVTSNVTLSGDLPIDADMKLEINKTLIVEGQKFPLTIPCVDGMGSCRLPVCDIFHLWYADLICPFFRSANRTCACPVRGPATFNANRVAVSVPLDKFKGVIAQFADGDYSVRFTITDHARSRNYACLDIRAHLTFQPN